MQSVIRHRDGRTVDLAGGVDAPTYAELEATQGHGSRRDPLLFCGRCNGGIYIRHGRVRRDELFGTHYYDGKCPETFIIRKTAPMSDEHKRMQEYTVLAANDGGFNADTEVRTTARTIVDVVIDQRIGIEIQRSNLTARAAVDRTARSMSAGLQSVAWVGFTHAQWTGKVPGYQWLDVDRVLREMPRQHSVRCRGVATVRPERDGYGKWWPVLEPKSILVDDAVVRMADGTIQPVVYGKYVRLITKPGIALYEDLMHQNLLPYDPGKPLARTLAPADGRECTRPPTNPMADVPFLVRHLRLRSSAA